MREGVGLVRLYGARETADGTGIAEKWEVRMLLLRKPRVLVEGIDADHEVGDVVLS